MDKLFGNPRPLPDLWDGHEIGDPFMMRFDGRFYLYCSSHGAGPGIKCWTSDDMIDFTYRGYVCEDERVWGAYAPEVCYIAGRFYMVTSPRGSGHYLLRAPSPLGPFEIISDNLGLGIDGSLFVDDDGRSYFYRASAQGVRVHDMPSPDRIDVHSRVIGASWLGHWTEGPMVVKRDDRYFLTNTGNHVLSRGYHVDYFVSHDGPDRGYYAMKEQQLLLETRDEYHALGHSSTCVGPDMDTLYIVYHKNILDEWNRPKHRSMCIDRLFFNGDRMYTNASWWPQRPPRAPVFSSRAGKGLIERDGGLATPVSTGDTYTAEVCGTLTGESGWTRFSAGERGCVALTIRSAGEWQALLTEDGATREWRGRLVDAINPKALLCVRASMRDGRLRLYVNGLEILRAETRLGAGRIELGGMKPGFAGFSDVAQGSREADDLKNIPGAFDACHALERPGAAEGERRCAAAVCAPGQTLTFPVSVCRDGRYHVACTIKAMRGRLDVAVNGEALSAPSCGVCDDQGMERRYLGEVSLAAGEGELTFTVNSACVIDRVCVMEADEFTPAQIIEAGRDVTNGALRVIGHKAAHSMLRKFSGYTCAENDGEGYFGGMWRDCQVRAAVNVDPCSPDAGAAIYLRSSRESWHPHQVRAGRRAYCVRILPGRVELAKQAYGETVLAAAKLDMALPGVLKLVCRVQGNRISVLRETAAGEMPLLCCVDAMAIPCGRVGIQATGDGIGFEAVRVEAPAAGDVL